MPVIRFGPLLCSAMLWGMSWPIGAHMHSEYKRLSKLCQLFEIEHQPTTTTCARWLHNTLNHNILLLSSFSSVCTVHSLPCIVYSLAFPTTPKSIQSLWPKKRKTLGTPFPLILYYPLTERSICYQNNFTKRPSTGLLICLSRKEENRNVSLLPLIH